jgi:cytochrome b561
MSLGTEKYSRIAVLLHWGIAVLILVNIALGLGHELVGEENIRFVIDTHKSIGITVLGLVLMRILWRLTHRPPPLTSGLKIWEKRLSQFVHGFLYFLMLALPLSGWMHDSAWKAAPEIPMRLFGLFEWPRIGAIMQMEPVRKEELHSVFGAAHENMGFILIALVLLHIAGALKHQFVDRDAELQRMWF